MKQTSAETPYGASKYEIRLKGHLDDHWTDWFDGWTLTREANGETLLSGPVIDQAALHGVLRKVRDLGLPLVSVTQGDSNRADRQDGDPGEGSWSRK